MWYIKMRWIPVVLIVVLVIIYTTVLYVILAPTTAALNDGQYVTKLHDIIERSDSLRGCVEGASVITLEEQDGARVQCVIDDAGALGVKVKPYVAKRSERGGKHGCFDSHQKLAQAALKQGLKRYCIFEDDARLTGIVPTGLSDEIKSALESEGATIVTMGYIVNPLVKMEPYKEFKHLKHIINPFILPALAQTQAYCMNEAAMKIISGLENDGMVHYDHRIFNTGLPIKILLTDPVIFTQCDCDMNSTVTFNMWHKLSQQQLSSARTSHYSSRLSKHAEWHWIFMVVLIILIITAVCIKKNKTKS